ncbi:MAG TPA: hypothetical protein DDW65_24780 [Firmicutes bacterium]|jgi:hypothetical protein|nr:hypothetical protein [Bacillota bacterium]
MKKYFLLVVAIAFLFSSIGLAKIGLGGLGGLVKDTKKESSDSKETSKALSQESDAEYTTRMIDTIKGFMDQGYYSEASYLLSDLSKITTTGEVADLQSKLNSVYSPEKENSDYNTDVMVPAKDFTGKYGYIDSTGNFVIPSKFDKADSFHEGLALVQIDKKQAFINRKGEIAIQITSPDKTEVEMRSGFNSGLAMGYRDVYSGDYSKKGYFYIDHTGKEVLFFPENNVSDKSYVCQPFSEGFAVVEKVPDIKGYINTKGEWLVEPTFSMAFNFLNGMALIMYPHNEKFGYIDTTGKPVIKPFVDDSANSFQDGVAWISTKDGFYGQIDKSGNRILDTNGMVIDKLPCKLLRSGNRTDGLTGFVLDRSGYVKEKDHDAIIFLDKNNKRVIFRIQNVESNVFDESVLGKNDLDRMQLFRVFSNGRTFLKTRYKGWLMIDMKGNIIVQPQTEWAPVATFTNGLAQIMFKNKGIGYINRDGKIVFKE